MFSEDRHAGKGLIHNIHNSCRTLVELFERVLQEQGSLRAEPAVAAGAHGVGQQQLQLCSLREEIREFRSDASLSIKMSFMHIKWHNTDKV